ncbi:hypothetical protein BW716_34785 [[Flexibacter] sp. ATCC 35208]|nr:hypothetical protein BW716_34785 [[Flexibacter] sp. ATCC 35208]
MVAQTLMRKGENQKITHLLVLPFVQVSKTEVIGPPETERILRLGWPSITVIDSPSGTSNFCGISFDADQSGYGLMLMENPMLLS